jgi:hypothetical protein
MAHHQCTVVQLRSMRSVAKALTSGDAIGFSAAVFFEVPLAEIIESTGTLRPRRHQGWINSGAPVAIYSFIVKLIVLSTILAYTHIHVYTDFNRNA